MLHSSSIPNMVNGVSQQPNALRLASQSELEINCYPSIVEGLTKRPPTKHRAKISSDPLTGAVTHLINRDVTERYEVIIMDGDLKVVTLDGEERAVAFPTGKDYLDCGGAEPDFKALTIQDHTFILNRRISVTEAAETTEDNGFAALVFVRQADYSQTLTVHCEGTSVSYTYPGTAGISTLAAASSLRSSLMSALGAGWESEIDGSVFWIRKTDGSSFTIRSTDTVGDNHVNVITNKVQRFSDLPTRAKNGFTCEVIGDNTSAFDNYFVHFDVFDGEPWGEGAWVETVKPGIPVGFTNETMPHVLRREADGSFTFEPQEWEPRKVGDEESAAMPTFVGKTINDIFFHRKRFGLLSSENVILSAAHDYFNFWPSTVTTIVDNDPIDVPANHKKVSILRHAVPYMKQLILFSDQTQFVMRADSFLASDPPDVDVLTTYESSLEAEPIGAGRVIFFATPKKANSGVRELFIQENLEVLDAPDVTAHVPAYLPGGVFCLRASPNEDTLLVLSREHPNEVYVYRYFWNGNEKMQSAWGKWTFPEGAVILDVDFIESSAYFVVHHPDGVYLERMDLGAGLTDYGSDITYHLDRRVDSKDLPAPTFDPVANTTTITLPYEPSDEIQVVSRHHDPNTETTTTLPGLVIPILSIVGTHVTLKGDHRGTPFFAGQVYRQRYRFSKPVIKEEAPGGGMAVVGEGRLQVLFWAVNYSGTGFFKARVSLRSREDRVYTFTGRVLGTGSTTLGETAISDGVFKFPIRSRNDRFQVELENDTHLPSRFVSAEWEGNYNRRSKRVR